ncbi:MAG: methyl-accepting chemotaxis protein [Plesiomonas shigelloides]
MDKKKNASVIRHMVIGFVVLVAAFIAANLFALNVSGQMKYSLDEVTQEAVPVTEVASELTLSLLTADKWLKSFVASRDPALLSSSQSAFEQGNRDYLQQLEAFKQLNAEHENMPVSQLAEVEKHYFAPALQTFQQYDAILRGRQTINAAVQSFQNKKMELQYGLKTLIDNGDNEVVKLTSGSFFNSLREMDQTTSDALASQDPAAIEKAMKANKVNIGRLGYAFKGLVAQVPMLGERYGEMFEAFLTDAGRKNGVLQQHYDFILQEQQVNQDIAALSAALEQALGMLQTLRDNAKNHMSLLAEQADTSYKRSFWVASALSLAVVLIAVITGWLLARSVRKPVQAILQTLRSIERGNMTERVAVSSDNEFGLIAEHINKMVAQLHHILEQISHSSTQLTHVTLLNQDNATVAKAAVESQREQTASVATAMSQMEHSVKEIARSVNHTLDQVLQLEATVTQSDALVQENVHTTQQLSDRLQSTAAVVKTVAGMSEKIGSILDVIRSIADQTNLLALNAAIEAARAGDMGRGFAVVADEVRVLAKRTTDSTGQIEQMISELQNGTRSALNTVEGCLNDMALSTSQTTQTGAAMKVIADGLGQISDMNSQIANAATEQEATSTDIARNLEEISRLADQNFASIEQMAGNSTQLENLAASQETLVRQFVL